MVWGRPNLHMIFFHTKWLALNSVIWAIGSASIRRIFFHIIFIQSCGIEPTYVLAEWFTIFLFYAESEPWCCCRLLMKWVVNKWPSYSKEWMLLVCRPKNHNQATFRSVMGKARYMTPSLAPCRSISALKLSRWSRRSVVPSYSSVWGILNLRGIGSVIIFVENGGSMMKSHSKG